MKNKKDMEKGEGARGEGRREKRERQQRDYESSFVILEIDELNAQAFEREAFEPLNSAVI